MQRGPTLHPLPLRSPDRAVRVEVPELHEAAVLHALDARFRRAQQLGVGVRRVAGSMLENEESQYQDPPNLGVSWLSDYPTRIRPNSASR